MRSVVATGEHRGDSSLPYSAFSMGLVCSVVGLSPMASRTPTCMVSGPMRLSEIILIPLRFPIGIAFVASFGSDQAGLDS